MADDDKRLAFDRDKAVFEQNCAQLRTLVQEMHKKPIMSATLTGALLTALSVFKMQQAETVGVLALIAVLNAFVAVTCIRLRDVIGSYIEAAGRFSGDFGMKGGRPTTSMLPWLGGFSIAFGYAFMMGTIVVAAWVAPFFLFGWAWSGLFPFFLTVTGLGAWAIFSIQRRRKDERDTTLAYYDKKWSEYVAKTENIDMSDVLNRFASRLPANARVLDVGAGSGRDAKAFRLLGYSVVALEPSEKLAAHLRGIEGIEVVQRGAEEVEEAARYDGIWACGSLIHLDETQLAAAMERLSHALKRDGHLYMSFKDGNRVRKAADGRLFHDMSPDALGQLARDHGLVVEDSWRSDSKMQGTNEAEWNNVIARKVG